VYGTSTTEEGSQTSASSAAINKGTSSTYTTEEQFEMFRMPFFKGKGYRAGVDVDNIGSVRDRWA
jgi:hypothetical protein